MVRPSSRLMAGHLGEHLCLEELQIAGAGAAGAEAVVEGGGFAGVEVGGGGGEVAVVGGRWGPFCLKKARRVRRAWR